MGAFLLQPEHFWCQALAVFAAGGDADLCKRAISFLYSSIWAWSEPFSRARSSMRCRRIETVVSDGFSRSDPRNISPFPSINQSGLNSSKMVKILLKISPEREEIIFFSLKFDGEIEIFSENFRMLTPLYLRYCNILSFVWLKFSCIMCRILYIFASVFQLESAAKVQRKIDTIK